MENDVFDRALIFLSGEITEEGREKLRLLCAAAAAQLEQRLRPGVARGALRESFVTAAGILALSMYAALGGQFDSVKIGSVTVSGDRLPERLRELAEAMLEGYLIDRGFDFRGVRG